MRQDAAAGWNAASVDGRANQIALRAVDLEGTVGPEHSVRDVWAFVERLDLSALYTEIGSIEGRAGRAAIDPKILTALWLYATVDGVGSAREIERLTETHDAYRWICGGVNVDDARCRISVAREWMCSMNCSRKVWRC